MFHYYKGLKVNVERSYMVGERIYLDLRDPRNGKMYTAVPLHELDKEVDNELNLNEDQLLVMFKKKDDSFVFNKDSQEYRAFVDEKGLNPLFIENCLKGVSKTHKGWEINYK